MKTHTLNPVNSRLLVAFFILACGIVFGQDCVKSSDIITNANITSTSSALSDKESAPNTGINELMQGNEDITVYPNPVSSELWIKNVTGASGLLHGEIYNTLGQMVSSFQITDLTTSIPVYRLSSGTYFIKLYNDKMQMVKKFSKL